MESSKLQGVYSRMQVWSKTCILEDESGKLEPLLQPFLKTPSVNMFLIGFAMQDETKDLINAFKTEPTNEELHEEEALKTIANLAAMHGIDLRY
jgi:hypothetical protein